MDGTPTDRERFLNTVWEEDREAVARALDAAEAAASQGRLAEAAAHLEELRRRVVEHSLFRNWDDGIAVFSGLIREIRARSSEEKVPRAYQRFLDAIPSPRYEDEMTRAQREFWYGPGAGSPYGRIGAPGGPGCVVWLAAAALLAGTAGLRWLA